MGLAWLLFIRSLRHSWRRLLLVIGAVGTGVLILFLFTAGYNGLTNRMDHTSWRQTVFQAVNTPQQETANIEPLYVMLSSTSNVDATWRDKQIEVTNLAASGKNSPSFSGISNPNSGEYYISPGLEKIINEHPEDAIGTRFGTKLVGVIPDKYVTSPDELAVIRGVDLSQAKQLEESGTSIAKLYQIPENSNPTASGYSEMLLIVLYLGIFILLFPVIILVSVATQLGGRQREARYASMRLVGATKAQTRRIMMVESLVASSIGIVVGILLYVIARPLVLDFKFQDMRFWPQEVAVSTNGAVGIIVATLIFTILVNWWAIRHVQTSPLGVIQKSSYRKQSHWWRLIPLLLGIITLLLGFLPMFDRQQNIVALLILGSVVMLMFGLVIAGPFVTRKISGWIGRHTRSAETLLGMKYISLNSRNVFRSVAGVVVALFAGSFFLACTSGVENLAAQSIADNGYSKLRADSVLVGGYVASNPFPEGQSEVFKKLDYVHSVTEIKVVSYSIAVIPCQVATEYTTIQCPKDKTYLAINFDRQDLSKELYGSSETDIYNQIKDSNPYFTMSVVASNYLLKINYNDIDKLRSFVVAHYMRDGVTNPFLFDGTDAQKPYVNPIIDEFANLAYVGIGITVLIAIVSLAISTIGALLERRRSLVTLRLGGMTVGGLKRVILIESLIPLLSVTIISAGLGLLVGFAMMYKLTTTVHSVLSIAYLELFGGCIVMAIVAIVCILPSVKRIANPEAMQTE